ncbi:hypothetical protein KSC_040690 [Ktedonobacter sp. SOSP1-52]|uniref:hypothetical protein n=1 Tax=Ktedonobacter sp. SOSP1-52 TaxID=2778366 RepID=UPI00191661A1|nr:hypothetical protein [Ktedonobacter sp. SOSP1-52]GHO65177.1 hypothetical protein KSC_040690 [Ktedonobacter sp. SOSP1-52]
MEWILLSTLPIICPSEAWEVVQWYGWRWLLEDFHKALKTGCRMEHHNVQSMEAQWKLLSVLSPIALRLLVIRHTAQQVGNMLATDAVSQKAIQVIIYLDRRHRSITTAQEVWQAIARLGGYLDRKSDGPWMAGLMERMDAGHGRLGGRSSRRSSPSFMICV